jgi:hypothetical protein
MGDRSLNAIRVLKCDHKKPHVYRQRQFDVLNGFELTFARCFTCNKIVGLEAKKFSKT